MRAAHFDRLSVNGGTDLFTPPLNWFLISAIQPMSTRTRPSTGETTNPRTLGNCTKIHLYTTPEPMTKRAGISRISHHSLGTVDVSWCASRLRKRPGQHTTLQQYLRERMLTVFQNAAIQPWNLLHVQVLQKLA